MDFNKARTFVEVVDRGGFTAAANYLQRTQQAISSQIISLEEDLGLSLLVRQGPKITLTADGERLYQLFKEHLVSIEGAIQHLKADKSTASGVIRLGTWLEGSIYHLPEVIKRFSEDYPRVVFEVHVATDEELETMLIANKIDISCQLFTKNQRLLRQIPVYRETLVPVVSRDYAQKYGLPKTIEETLEIPLVDFYSEYSNYEFWVKKNNPTLFLEAQKKVMLVRVSNTIALKQLILRGIGMGFLIQSTIQSEINSGELISPDFLDIEGSNWVEFDAVYKRQNSLGFIHQEFIRYILEYGELESTTTPVFD